MPNLRNLEIEELRYMYRFGKSIKNQPSWLLSLAALVQGSYLPTILKNVLCLVLQIFLYLAAFECDTTSDWLNYTV